MGVNLDKPNRWKRDIADSVDMYNDWFMRFAPEAFRSIRVETTEHVESALRATDNLRDISPELLIENPSLISTLRMATCPPLAVDRLIGLAGVSNNLVKRMEKDGKLPSHMSPKKLRAELDEIGNLIEKMADPDIFTWLQDNKTPSERELYRAATVVADRLCGSRANPIIRNAQEQRQLEAIATWLSRKGYAEIKTGQKIRFNEMKPGTFSFRTNVPVQVGGKQVNIPVDAAVKPFNSDLADLPLFFEAKSAGDFTNVNKRRKEEAVKMSQLRSTYGDNVQFNLFLCGYFNSGYLGYEAAEGIDWVWEHRIDDLEGFGL